MPDHISVTFLGTAAGRPSSSRNVSSLAIKLDKAIWVVDAGEGTQHQFMASKLKMSHVTKIFITHLHGDHILGLPGLLCTISAGEGSVLPGEEDPRIRESAKSSIKPTEIFGPKGLRHFLRMSLAATYSVLSRPYVVHELLFPGEEPTIESEESLHVSERKGRDIAQADGVWKSFDSGLEVDVSAGPILHTVPCIGYVFTENPRPLPIIASDYIPHLMRSINADALKAQGHRDPRAILSVLSKHRQPITLEDGTVLTPPEIGGPGRKLVVLGDTYDAGGCESLAVDADLVVHESTNAFLPELDESQRRPGITLESVRETAKSHGHSTPDIAGGFARRVRAKGLVLNHLSVKYPAVPEEEEEGESEPTKHKRRCLREIERLASEAWGLGQARAAFDFLTVDVKPSPNQR